MQAIANRLCIQDNSHAKRASQAGDPFRLHALLATYLKGNGSSAFETEQQLCFDGSHCSNMLDVPADGGFAHAQRARDPYLHA